MRQLTFADKAFERYLKPTRRRIFLGETEEKISLHELREVIQPFYPNRQGAGRSNRTRNPVSLSGPGIEWEFPFVDRQWSRYSRGK